MPSPHRHWPTRLPMTVLIVYGDDGLLRRIARSLSGLTCVTATTGEAALAWLGEGVPDLMVVDLDLPDMPAQEQITRQKNAGELVPRRRGFSADLRRFCLADATNCAGCRFPEMIANLERERS
jgi:CheY-like chemotaxis protein